MLKFFMGVIVGVVVVVLIVVIGIFAVAGMRNKGPVVADNSTLVLHLDGELPERAPVTIPFLGFAQRTPMTVADVWSTLRKAAADPRVKAIVLEPRDLSVGWAKMQELHADIEQFRKSGKPVYAYLKTPGTREYYVATAASKVFIAPEDMLNLKGLRFELMYFKRSLDKLGVSVDIEHAGKYKDFGDMFTRTNMSPETREVLTTVLDDLYADLTNTIATSRKKSVDEIREAIDNGPLLSPQIKARGLVDELCYEDEMFGKLKNELRGEVNKFDAHEYSKISDSDAGVNTKQRVALVVGEGTITRGDAEGGTGDGIESENFTRLLAKVGNDSSLKAVIVRIDSGGGEVFASDAIWRAMNDLAKKKALVISMSDAAASGGYYLSMAGAPIVAYPGTLTGSIGVVFGKPNLHGLYDKLGIDKDRLERGRFAGIDADDKSLNDVERNKLREGIDENYRTFVQKVADSRKRKFAEIEPLAQGRVWLGDQAKANGLVDELGGLDRAIDVVKRRASIPAGDLVTLVPYPASRSLLDLLFSTRSPEASADERIAQALGVRTLLPRRAHLIDSNVRVWLGGGFLSVSPYSLTIQ